ncbi:MAG: acyl-CoA dehydrogenase family protein [Sulfuricaulis sp.]|nr:acyl-CoA dehydrogenase family protein [Sulfuricaulis sp.]
MNSKRLPLLESESMVLVRDSARGFLETHWPVGQAVALAGQAQAMLRLWRQAAGQGWTALGIDDAEMGLGAALVLLQELGRASCPIPLMDAVLANAALGASQGAVAASLLEQLRRGEAAVTWVFGPDSGEVDAFELALGHTLEGRAAFIENTGMATHLLVVTGRPGEIAVVARDAPGLGVTPTPGLNDPPLAQLRWVKVERFELIQTDLDLAYLAPLARLMLAARATGAARRGLELLTDYAKVRSQFGKKIGQFQAIQHKLANCLSSVEICRLAVLAAGRADASGRRYGAAVASANAGHLLRQVVLELHHGFGGVSFWDEHELPRHFRRIHGDLTRLGGVQGARRDLAAHLLARGAVPDLALSEGVDAFRREVREWLAQNWDGQYPPATHALPVNHRKARQDFSRKLGARGWLGITWPKAYGGQERTALEHLAFEEEMAYAEAPVTFHNTAVNMIGPALVSFGTSAQKAYFLPGIARGDISFALGYSEPDHGSDLAGIKTSAMRTDDGGWLVRGQKIYTSTAGFSTHVWLAARTDPSQARQAGISVFAVPLDSPGITLQPMSGLNGHRANIVFLDDVRLAADTLIGEVNGGWKVISDALAYERVTLAAIGARARGYFDRLLAHVGGASRNGRPMAQDSLVLDRVGALGAEVEAARLLAVQAAQVVEQGEVPVWQAAMVKVYASELMERLSEAAFDLLGAGATLKDGAESALADGVFEYAVRDALLYTIGGGTNEIQRTLIALRGLDLPR